LTVNGQRARPDLLNKLARLGITMPVHHTLPKLFLSDPKRLSATKELWKIGELSSSPKKRVRVDHRIGGISAAQIFFCKIAQGFLLKVDLVSIFWVRFVRF
jgi:hypothetical protein